MKSHPNHPGFDAHGCACRITVTGRRTDGASGGYACAETGGHCLPSEGCDALRRNFADHEAMRETLSR